MSAPFSVVNLSPKNPLRGTRYAAFFVKPPGDDWDDEDEDDDEVVLDEEATLNADD